MYQSLYMPIEMFLAEKKMFFYSSLDKKFDLI